MAYKMKGFSGFGNSPAKQGVITPKKLTPEEEKENIQNRNKNKPGPWDHEGITPPPPHPNSDNRKKPKPGPWDHEGITPPPPHPKKGKEKISPAKQKKKGDKYGPIKKGSYPNLVENQSEVQKDKKGLYTTGLEDWDTHSVSDTTRYPQGFSDYKGEIKEGDYIDETTHEDFGGVDVESTPKEGESQPATGVRKVYNKKTKKYEDYKSKK